MGRNITFTSRNKISLLLLTTSFTKHSSIFRNRLIYTIFNLVWGKTHERKRVRERELGRSKNAKTHIY